MKALVLHEYGGRDQLKWENWNDPVAGRVRCWYGWPRVASIRWITRCGRVRAKQRFPVEFPGILGRDVSGVVRAVGEGVIGFEPGDRVFALAWHTYAELCVVKAADLAKVPEGWMWWKRRPSRWCCRPGSS